MFSFLVAPHFEVGIMVDFWPCKGSEKCPETDTNLRTMDLFRPLLISFSQAVLMLANTKQQVHTKDHYAFVKATADATDEQLIELSESPRMDSIYFNRLSFFSSKLSAGGAIETCRAVMNRKVRNAIAVIRPPGHHAEVAKTMGFCLFNNVCVASRVCQNDFGEQCRKILILDW